MAGGRALGDDELLGDLAVGQPRRDQDGDLLLAARQDRGGAPPLGAGVVVSRSGWGWLGDVRRGDGLVDVEDPASLPDPFDCSVA